jgi:ADP-glucose pyrophosphorylase
MTLSNFPNSSVKNVGIGTCAENCYTLQHVSSMKKEKTRISRKKEEQKMRQRKKSQQEEGKTEFQKNRELQKLDLLKTFHLGLNV